MSTSDELREGAAKPGTRADETVPATSGTAGSFDSRHGEFTDGAAGAGIDPETGRPAHGDGIEDETPEQQAAEQDGRDDQQRYVDQQRDAQQQ